MRSIFDRSVHVVWTPGPAQAVRKIRCGHSPWRCKSCQWSQLFLGRKHEVFELVFDLFGSVHIVFRGLDHADETVTEGKSQVLSGSRRKCHPKLVAAAICLRWRVHVLHSGPVLAQEISRRGWPHTSDRPPALRTTTQCAHPWSCAEGEHHCESWQEEVLCTNGRGGGSQQGHCTQDYERSRPQEESTQICATPPQWRTKKDENEDLCIKFEAPSRCSWTVGLCCDWWWVEHSPVWSWDKTELYALAGKGRPTPTKGSVHLCPFLHHGDDILRLFRPDLDWVPSQRRDNHCRDVKLWSVWRSASATKDWIYGPKAEMESTGISGFIMTMRAVTLQLTPLLSLDLVTFSCWHTPLLPGLSTKWFLPLPHPQKIPERDQAPQCCGTAAVCPGKVQTHHQRTIQECHVGDAQEVDKVSECSGWFLRGETFGWWHNSPWDRSCNSRNFKLRRRRWLIDSSNLFALCSITCCMTDHFLSPFWSSYCWFYAWKSDFYEGEIPQETALQKAEKLSSSLPRYLTIWGTCEINLVPIWASAKEAQSMSEVAFIHTWSCVDPQLQRKVGKNHGWSNHQSRVRSKIGSIIQQVLVSTGGNFTHCVQSAQSLIHIVTLQGHPTCKLWNGGLDLKCVGTFFFLRKKAQWQPEKPAMLLNQQTHFPLWTQLKRFGVIECTYLFTV